MTYWLLPAGVMLSAAVVLGRVDAGPGLASGARAPSLEPCRAAGPLVPLPAAMRETSGLARSRRDPGVLWTHNDSGRPVLFAVDTSGRLVGEVEVAGATLEDWEDLEMGPCDGGSCLYIGDIGDNASDRRSVAIHVVPEPEAGASRSAPAAVLRARYPDGPRDAEAMFVLPTGDIYLVTKGRDSDIALYRLARDRQRPGGTATLERVRTLGPRPKQPHRVTGASASPDGRWVAIRTYSTLHLYRAAELTGAGPARPLSFDLTPLRERQGEAVVLTDEGDVWLTSEAGRRRDLPALGRLRCTLGAAAATR